VEQGRLLVHDVARLRQRLGDAQLKLGLHMNTLRADLGPKVDWRAFWEKQFEVFVLRGSRKDVEGCMRWAAARKAAYERPRPTLKDVEARAERRRKRDREREEPCVPVRASIEFASFRHGASRGRRSIQEP
jgi:hypothetical protein